ncbi:MULTISPECIES: hypothetical protein [unclassified Paraburkholderia]|uniref:portal protein n=1 Tax=unclassified Paraburkholderia TaxID=2615204 RepID=UPI001611532C|nr:MULTISPECIES: hypothetical protein [unclassified Paraburkholderia]MBB5448211.1 hypothetical protein [Paraburkholderia sp. WSM4177]MBB5488614.1 hypothetical protein [Paraburkholderia sp. WSM4180]
MSESLIGMKASPIEQPPPGARFQKAKEQQAERPISELAAHVRECWRTNHAHRESSGIEKTMLRCTRQRNGEYDAEDLPKLGGIDVFINITGLKCRAAEAWIKDVLVNAADMPWTIEPTPIPDLPDYMLNQVSDLVIREVIARGYPNPVLDEARAKELKATALREMQRLAAEACSRMTDKINDQMTEAGWRAVFEQWQSDIVTYPGGVLKGPVVRYRRTLQWNGNALVTNNEPMQVPERVSPLDLYPSPEATNPQDANNLIERMRMTKAKLFECIGLPNFNEDAIRMVIAEYENGFRDWLSSDGARAHDEKKQGTLWHTSETIDVLDFWGRVQGSLLQEWGIKVDDPEAQYECNVWLVGDYAIRALLNPDPLGRRPYHVTSFNKLPGQFWGEGVPQFIRDIQRSANAAVRSLLKNMAHAGGPMVEIDVDRLDESEDKPEEIMPWKVYYTKPGNAGSGAAVRYVVAPSIAAELMNIFDRFSKLADDFSGIPAYTYGNSQVGGAGQTMGGLSLLYGGALKGIKNVIMNMDRDGIEPIISQYWTFNMLFDPDPTIKADSKVVAKGAEGILQREQSQARSIETLQAVTPYVEGGLVPKQAAQDMLKQWLGEQGYDVTLWFPDNQVDQEIASAFGGGGAPGASQPSMQPGTPPPALDGRQAAAVQATQGGQFPSP